MQVTIDQLRPYLHSFDFRGLFVEGLGWNHYEAEPVQISLDGHDYALEPVAEKASYVVYVCGADADGLVPPYPIRRKIERRVAKLAFEHIIVFVDAEHTSLVRQWVRRESGKPDACREQQYHSSQQGDSFLQSLREIAFSLDEEESLGVAKVASRVKQAMDVGKVTKQFYERFRQELDAFQGFINGIAEQGGREWYASLMLNRMMFIYFVQKQGFLDDDTDYLRNRLCMVQQKTGAGQFQQFYRIFLLRLFHEGLGQPESERAPELAELLGKVPFLNGGLFDVHDLERDNPDISIPDEAFERVFDFFEGYRWHLDERPRREDNEINPDVLGYIFEKYINQKQMGAYYTKEDITGYITRNTVIPFLFDAAKKECPVAFSPGGGVWRLLQDDPDLYIYPAVAHGVAWRYSPDVDPKRLEQPIELPEEIAAGIDDVSKRGEWNSPAADEYALPTETWREVVARRQRYAEVREQLASGKVQDVNDLITLNLDIEQFAKDVIVQSEGPELLRAFWHGMRDVSVLDPTCGSGAFLFAALNILEPLYTACLEGMQGFRDDLERIKRPHHPKALSDFRDVLEKVKKHPSTRYFILKSIVLNNLYGVDIMEEAVEICKLRLFLKLVAQLKTYDQIEPLPDIDFNIRAGNTLVGFTSLEEIKQTLSGDLIKQLALPGIEERAEIAAQAFRMFQRMQTDEGMDSGDFAPAKVELKERLDELRGELDSYLATEYGVKPEDETAYQKWRTSHQPFHWFVEFYDVMHRGGFDVIVGNPPYVNCKSLGYAVQFSKSLRFPDIYGYVVMQSHRITSQHGRCGFIVPLSVTFSFEFSDLRGLLASSGTHWFSSFDNIPAALFSGVSQRCTIWISSSAGGDSFATRLFRWRSAYRTFLLNNITYNKADNGVPTTSFGIPRLTNFFGAKLLALHIKSSSSKLISSHDTGRTTIRLGFSPTARNFISTYIEPPPVLHEGNGSVLGSTQCGWMTLPSDEKAFAALAITAGDACFWYWLTRGDGFHVTNWLLIDLLAPIDSFPTDHLCRLATIGELLHQYRYSALVFKKNAGKYVGNFNYQKLLSLTRKADIVFLSGLGASWDDLRELFSFTSLVRGINQEAGEKNIPMSVRKLFVQPDSIDFYNDHRLHEIDEWISTTYSIESRLVDGISSV